MVQQKWILLALVGAVLICEASGLYCVQCNTDEADCISGQKAPTVCDGAVSDALNCYVRITQGKVDRGCLAVGQESTCSSDDGTTCKRCTGDNCNNFSWPRCHQCATTDATCSDEQNGDGAFCVKYKAGGKCFERFVGGKVERGCEIDLPTPTEDVCLGNEECNACATGDSCNKNAGRVFQVTKCVQCDTINDADGTCLDGSKAATNCANPSDKKCYSRVLADGSLKQGCHSELSPAEVTTCTGTSCNICNGDECNKRVFPANRLGCNQCQKSAADADCAADLTGNGKSKLCQKYVENDKCYSRVTAASNFERGCQSDLPDNEKGCTDLVNCFECEAKNCNDISEEKLKASTKCQQCNSDDPACLAGTAPAQSCGQENDVCFVRINSEGKLERNCLSSLTDDAEKLKCNTDTDKTCIACEAAAADAACNSQKWLQCHKCSGTDQNCANAQAGAPAFCTNYRESDKCYERFVDGKEVQRGCEADLSPETENVCVGNQQCQTCTADGGCNKDVSTTFQVTKCVQCKSDADADGNCVKGTKVATDCIIPDGKCFSRIIEGGILERDCRSALTAQEQTACTGELCNLCGEAGCNEGVFPANRPQCYQCVTTADDKTCAAELTGDANSKLCQNYVENDKCYSRVTAASNFERGCQSDLPDNEKGCNGFVNCFECEGENCNALSEEKLKAFTKCQRCNSDDPACLAGTAPAQSCGQENDVCFVRINSEGKLERNCLSSLTDDADKLKCNTDTDKTCKACEAAASDAACNSQKWLQCHKCSGTDQNCANAQAGAPAFCTNYRESDKCYERFVDGKEVQRGCEADLSPETENVCVGNQQCKACTEDGGCNKDVSTTFQVTKCIQCKSGADRDESCLKGTKAATDCIIPDGKCFSKIITDGTLERDCRSALTAQEQTTCTGELCTLCGEAGCNEGVFPANRPQCYQCVTTADDKTCAAELTGDDKSGICSIYKANDRCYSRVTASWNFERGCQSDLVENAKTCDGLSDCLECEGSNCNGLSEVRLKGWAKCLQCDTDDDACIQATVDAATCEKEGDSCLVRINNGKLERNCLSSLSETDQAKCSSANDLSCVTCTGAGCNVQKWIKCHQCKESTSETCKAVQVDANAAYCPKYKENNQCYERLESEKVVRGCSSDLSEAPCSNNLECKICEGNACNKEAASTLPTSQRCLQCSTASDAGGLCLAGTTSTLPCTKDSESKCFLQVQTDGHLKRGCKGDLSAAQVTACTGDSCKICNEPSCNTGVYPEGRLRCYQCKSSDDDNCLNELQGPENSAFCKLYKEGDKCYSRDASDDLFERGCQSDLGLDADACKDLDSLHCQSCDGPDCNALSKKTLNGAGTVALNVVLLGIVLILGVFSVL